MSYWVTRTAVDMNAWWWRWSVVLRTTGGLELLFVFVKLSIGRSTLTLTARLRVNEMFLIVIHVSVNCFSGLFFSRNRSLSISEPLTQSGK